MPNLRALWSVHCATCLSPRPNARALQTPRARASITTRTTTKEAGVVLQPVKTLPRCCLPHLKHVLERNTAGVLVCVHASAVAGVDVCASVQSCTLTCLHLYSCCCCRHQAGCANLKTDSTAIAADKSNTLYIKSGGDAGGGADGIAYSSMSTFGLVQAHAALSRHVSTRMRLADTAGERCPPQQALQHRSNPPSRGSMLLTFADIRCVDGLSRTLVHS